jgi:hypothetical protein
MDCKDITSMLSAYYDKELDAGEREKVSAHLKTCKSCMAEYSDICRSWEALKAAGDVPVPKGFSTRVMARVNAFSAKRTRRFGWQAAAIAAVFILAFGLVFLLTRPAESPVAQNTPIKADITNPPSNVEKIAAPVVNDEDALIIEHLDILENYDILEDMDELIDMEALEEITEDELEGVE